MKIFLRQKKYQNLDTVAVTLVKRHHKIEIMSTFPTFPCEKIKMFETILGFN